MATGADKDDFLIRATAIKPVNQQEVAADMTFTMIYPVTNQSMIQPFRPKRLVVGDEQ